MKKRRPDVDVANDVGGLFDCISADTVLSLSCHYLKCVLNVVKLILKLCQMPKVPKQQTFSFCFICSSKLVMAGIDLGSLSILFCC